MIMYTLMVWRLVEYTNVKNKVWMVERNHNCWGIRLRQNNQYEWIFIEHLHTPIDSLHKDTFPVFLLKFSNNYKN